MERSNPSPRSSAQAGAQPRQILAYDPAARHVTIILIREELKNRKLFEDLHWLNYHSTFYKSDLLDIIMDVIGLDRRSSMHRSLCHTLLDRHSQRVVESMKELTDEATRVYDALVKHAVQTRLRDGEDLDFNFGPFTKTESGPQTPRP